MWYFRLGPGLTAWFLLFSVFAFLASGAALAATAVTNYVVINPIDVCDSTGKNCAPSGMSCALNNQGVYSCTTFNVLSAAGPSAPIGFVDMTTNPATNMPNNVNITRAIWLQAGIDVVFLPLQQYNSPATTDPWCGSPCIIPLASWTPQGSSVVDYRTLHVVNNLKCFDNVATISTSPDFQALTRHAICAQDMGPPSGAPQPTSQAGVPLASTLPNLTLPNAIDMFFVNQFIGSSGITYGFAWINGNGIAIASTTFVPPVLGATPRFDTLAHEIGHNLNLDHTTFGNLDTVTGVGFANNVMTAGDGSRAIPSKSGCEVGSTLLPGGALYDLATGQCGTLAPMSPISDRLILPTRKMSTGVQQTEAVLSGFMVPTSNVPATATAGGGAAATTTATTTTTTTTAALSTSGPISFTVTYPRFAKAGGRSANQFLIALVVGLPQNFNFGTAPFVQIGTTPQVVSTELLNGNNGMGNIHCLKPINGAPSIKCLEIDFLVTEPESNTFVGSFTTNTTLTFTSDIVDGSGNPATLAELGCTTPGPLQCLDLTYVFGDLFATTSAFGSPVLGVSTANSQSPDATVTSAIVNAADFPSVQSLSPPLTFTGFPLNGGIVPCTPTNNSTSCPFGTLPQSGD